MKFPKLSDAVRLARLAPPTGTVPVVLDTDTYNEVDDQFAVVHALLSPDKIDLQALYAAPFSNARSSGPADGMEKSYAEILRLLERLDVVPVGGPTWPDFVFRGSDRYLSDGQPPVDSAAARDLIAKSMDVFLDAERGLIFENVAPDGQHVDSFEGRLLNPGHGIEAMWFVMDVAQRWQTVAGKQQVAAGLIARATDTVLSILEFGWDEVYGGGISWTRKGILRNNWNGIKSCGGYTWKRSLPWRWPIA